MTDGITYLEAQHLPELPLADTVAEEDDPRRLSVVHAVEGDEEVLHHQRQVLGNREEGGPNNSPSMQPNSSSNHWYTQQGIVTHERLQRGLKQSPRRGAARQRHHAASWEGSRRARRYQNPQTASEHASAEADHINEEPGAPVITPICQEARFRVSVPPTGDRQTSPIRGVSTVSRTWITSLRCS